MRNARRRAAASGIWSPSLYFQFVRGGTGDELRISLADAVYRWKFAWGLPGAIGERGFAVEGTMVALGSLMATDGVVDEGFCYVEPFERGALGHFLLGYLDGALTLTLAGRMGREVIELVRYGSEMGPGAEWRALRAAAAEQVA